MSDSLYSLYIADAINNFLWRAVALPTIPNPVYCSLWTVAPLRDGTGGTEATNYTRLAVTRSTSLCSASSANSYGRIDLLQTLSFPAAATGGISSGSNIVAVGFHDAITAGNLLSIALVQTPVGFTVGQIPIFQPSGLTWGFDVGTE